MGELKEPQVCGRDQNWPQRLAPGEQPLDPAREIALYLHIPFCKSRCHYCDFPTQACAAASELPTRYVAALVARVRAYGEAGLLRAVASVYVGGGTPSFLGPQLLGALLKEVRVWTPSAREVTFEANPDSLTPQVLAAAAAAGATRVSVGVQSFDPACLKLLGRVHTAAAAKEALECAASAGLDVSCDLMVAVPGQVPGDARRSVEAALAAGATHVSVYPLQIEDGTRFARRIDAGSMREVESATAAAHMEEAAAALEAAGLARYEVASYARPGKRCVHNQAYWTGVPYLGLGTGAASCVPPALYQALHALPAGFAPAVPLPLMAPASARKPAGGARLDALAREEPAPPVARVRFTDVRTPEAFIAAQVDGAFELEWLSAREAAAEDVMLAARMTEGLTFARVARAQAVLGAELVEATLSNLATSGFIAPAPFGWRVTSKGWLLGNELYGPLWDLHEHEG